MAVTTSVAVPAGGRSSMGASGTLPPLPLRQPLDHDDWRRRLPRGQVHLIPERCKGCRLCVEFCPQQVLVLSEAMNAKGYHYPIVASGKQESCVVCGFCSLICPEFAIFATEVEPAPAATQGATSKNGLAGEIRQ